MEELLAFVMEVLFEMLMIIPGAVIRWILAGGKKPFKYYCIDDYAYFNGSIAILFLGGIFAFISLFS